MEVKFVFFCFYFPICHTINIHTPHRPVFFSFVYYETMWILYFSSFNHVMKITELLYFSSFLFLVFFVENTLNTEYISNMEITKKFVWYIWSLSNRDSEYSLKLVLFYYDKKPRSTSMDTHSESMPSLPESIFSWEHLNRRVSAIG